MLFQVTQYNDTGEVLHYTLTGCLENPVQAVALPGFRPWPLMSNTPASWDEQ